MRTITILMLLLATALAGCDHKGGDNPNRNRKSGNANVIPVVSVTPPPPLKPAQAVDPSFKSCNSYFPLAPGSLAKYTLSYSSGIKANVEVIIARQPDQDGKPVFLETTQIVDSTGGLHKKSLDQKQYICDDGKIQFLSRSEDNEVDGSKNHIDIRYSKPAVLVVEPSAMKPGTSWSYDFFEKFQVPGQAPVDTNKRYTVSSSVVGPQDVTVPAGTFKTLKVLRRSDTSTVYEYYARGLGLVKRETADGTSWELREFSGIRAED